MPMIPARWRMITEDDRAIVSFQCSGDGVDSCRAPASWVAERLDNSGAPIAIVTSRCPDHIPVRALQTLVPIPVVTREGIRMAMTKPPVHASQPPVEDVQDVAEVRLPETIEMAVVKPESERPKEPPKDTETEPAIADTQEAEKYKSPPPAPLPPPSSSIPPVAIDPHLDEDD